MYPTGTLIDTTEGGKRVVLVVAGPQPTGMFADYIPTHVFGDRRFDQARYDAGDTVTAVLYWHQDDAAKGIAYTCQQIVPHCTNWPDTQDWDFGDGDGAILAAITLDGRAFPLDPFGQIAAMYLSKAA